MKLYYKQNGNQKTMGNNVKEALQKITKETHPGKEMSTE